MVRYCVRSPSECLYQRQVQKPEGEGQEQGLSLGHSDDYEEYGRTHRGRCCSRRRRRCSRRRLYCCRRRRRSCRRRRRRCCRRRRRRCCRRRRRCRRRY